MEELEQIMRKIHVLFAKCESYGDEQENKLIVPKKEVFRLLEQMNVIVLRMMDQYEGTKESRERGMSEYRREADRIIGQANAGAEDVYAASLIYTDNVIEELEAVISDAKESLWAEYARMAERLDAQTRLLAENQEEIKLQMEAMAQGKKYLRLIERENERLKQFDDMYEEDEETAEAESADEQRSDALLKELSYDVNEEEDITKEPQEASSESDDTKADQTSGKNTASKAPLNKHRKRRRAMEALEAEWQEQEKERPARKIGTALYQEVGQSYDPPVKKVSYEVKVNQAYFDQLGEGNIDLDAEYEQWKEEQAQAAGEAGQETAVAEEENRKEERAGRRKKKKGVWHKR